MSTGEELRATFLSNVQRAQIQAAQGYLTYAAIQTLVEAASFTLVDLVGYTRDGSSRRRAFGDLRGRKLQPRCSGSF
jgi:hypothetical protein